MYVFVSVDLTRFDRDMFLVLWFIDTLIGLGIADMFSEPVRDK